MPEPHFRSQRAKCGSGAALCGHCLRETLCLGGHSEGEVSCMLTEKRFSNITRRRLEQVDKFDVKYKTEREK